jgi:hypothetical protein
MSSRPRHDARLLAAESLSSGWLSSRIGVDPGRIDAMRRAGELLGVREPGGRDYRYPAWQFNGGRTALPVIQELIRAARAAGVDDDGLYEILNRRSGMGGKRLAEYLKAGDHEYVRRAVRGALH